MSDKRSPAKLKLPWRRWALLAVTTLVIGYTVVVVFFTVFQRNLIYVPTRVTMEQARRKAVREGFIPWRNKAGQLIGWELVAGSKPAGSVLIVHGNAGWALTRAYLAKSIHDAAPLDVFILEYPGYGAREGSPAGASFLSAGDEAFGNLPANAPVYVVSESLGTGVAAHLAEKNPAGVAGLALFVPYDRLALVAQNQVPYLPAYFLLLDRYDPVDWLKEYHGPVMVILAGSDEIIPPRLGRHLYDEYTGPKMLQVMPGARHNQTTDQSPDWWKDVLEFWREYPAASSPPAKPLASVTPG